MNGSLSITLPSKSDPTVPPAIEGREWDVTMFHFCPNLPLLCQKCETLGREGNPAFHSRLTECASTKNAKAPAMDTGASTGRGHDRGC
jgi:hypothetical protein